ncbi:MAG TPA: hypothetical protein DEP84_29785, partial [Chloroflexi bacterium]|nr:hypothetical protein [Chloroflexota bacterium]
LLTAGGGSVALPWRTALGQGAAIAETLRTGNHQGVSLLPVEALVLPGALTNGVANELAAGDAGPLAIVVPDAACLLLDAPHARRLGDRGISLAPLHVTPLLAVTVNPYRHGRQSLPAGELRDALAGALAPVPVINVADEGAVLATAQLDVPV